MMVLGHVFATAAGCLAAVLIIRFIERRR
ncbi:hypothetical protein CLS_15260 [[Clostridium] cf. saccharolyticum K10]|nr:hypothetical protein CLS_15260 [[Clostridium] cf. saccharolyticum K10]